MGSLICEQHHGVAQESAAPGLYQHQLEFQIPQRNVPTELAVVSMGTKRCVRLIQIIEIIANAPAVSRRRTDAPASGLAPVAHYRRQCQSSHP